MSLLHFIIALQASLLDALSAAGYTINLSDSAVDTDSSGSSADLLFQLAAVLSRNLLKVLLGSKKRQLLVSGALVNTLMLPELMVFDAAQQPQLVALHSGPEAPLRRFVADLLHQSAQGSPTFALVVALRLGACIPDAPELLGWYADELKHLLLFGATMDGGLEATVSLTL